MFLKHRKLSDKAILYANHTLNFSRTHTTNEEGKVGFDWTIYS
jgi:hypothetical protein